MAELMQAVGIAIIAYAMYDQVAEWLSVCGVYYRKGPEFDSRLSHFFFQCQHLKYIKYISCRVRVESMQTAQPDSRKD